MGSCVLGSNMLDTHRPGGDQLWIVSGGDRVTGRSLPAESVIVLAFTLGF